MDYYATDFHPGDNGNILSVNFWRRDIDIQAVLSARFKWHNFSLPLIWYGFNSYTMVLHIVICCERESLKRYQYNLVSLQGLLYFTYLYMYQYYKSSPALYWLFLGPFNSVYSDIFFLPQRMATFWPRAGMTMDNSVIMILILETTSKAWIISFGTRWWWKMCSLVCGAP